MTVSNVNEGIGQSSGGGQPPLVSVVIATLNAGATLARCLESVLRQTYPQREILVMDGASNDDTPRILNDYGQALTYWESVSDRGIYHAWNKALERATGEWICFLGADDYFPNTGRLERLVATGTSAIDIDLVFGRAAIVDQEGRVRRVVGNPWDWGGMRSWQVVAHSGALQRRSLFERHGNFSENFKIAGDYEFLLRLGPSVRTAFLDEVLVCMDQGGQSRRLIFRALAETRMIQQGHGGVGAWRANWNLLVGLTKAILRKLVRAA